MKTKLLLGMLAVAAALGLTSRPETRVPRDFGAKPLKLKGDEKPHNHCLLAADAANYAKLTDAKFWE